MSGGEKEGYKAALPHLRAARVAYQEAVTGPTPTAGQKLPSDHDMTASGARVVIAAMNEGERLEACPFCGGEAQRLTIGEDEPNNAGGDVIVCTRCQASSHVEFGRKENLVSRWNNRAEALTTRSIPSGEEGDPFENSTLKMSSEGHNIILTFDSRDAQNAGYFALKNLLRSTHSIPSGGVRELADHFEANPFVDDAPLVGTTQQRLRCEHYAALVTPSPEATNESAGSLANQLRLRSEDFYAEEALREKAEARAEAAEAAVEKAREALKSAKDEMLSLADTAERGQHSGAFVALRVRGFWSRLDEALAALPALPVTQEPADA